MSQSLYHKNVAGGPAVKGVECRFCGEYVGLVQSTKTGKWYTCQLVASMNPDSSARNAYPFLPHFPECKINQRVAEMVEAWSKDNGGEFPPYDVTSDMRSAARAEIKGVAR